MGSSHRIAKPSRNYMGVLKQNFDRICAKIAILEGKVNGQEGKLSDQEETLRDQEEKLRNQEEELNDLKMQRDDKGEKLITQLSPCIMQIFLKVVKKIFF